jgi:hypothetical protein
MTMPDAVFELLKQRRDPFEAPVRGISMGDAIPNESHVRIEPLALRNMATGDVVVFRDGERLVGHRLTFRARGYAIMLGDGYRVPDLPVRDDAVVGRVVAIQSGGEWKSIDARPHVPVTTSIAVVMASAGLLISPWLARKIVAAAVRVDRALRD